MILLIACGIAIARGKADELTVIALMLGMIELILEMLVVLDIFL